MPALESQLQALHLAAATAITVVNARGATIVDRLQDIHQRAQDIAGHRVRLGAAVALATVQSQLEYDLWHFHSAIPEGEDRRVLKELVLEFDEAARTISAEVNVEAVVNRVFLGN